MTDGFATFLVALIGGALVITYLVIMLSSTLIHLIGALPL